MPRIPRGQVAGHAYHVLNRGNGGGTVFHKEVKVLGLCLMPNHLHLVIQPETQRKMEKEVFSAIGSKAFL